MLLVPKLNFCDKMYGKKQNIKQKLTGSGPNVPAISGHMAIWVQGPCGCYGHFGTAMVSQR